MYIKKRQEKKRQRRGPVKEVYTDGCNVPCAVPIGSERKEGQGDVYGLSWPPGPSRTRRCSGTSGTQRSPWASRSAGRASRHVTPFCGPCSLQLLLTHAVVKRSRLHSFGMHYSGPSGVYVVAVSAEVLSGFLLNGCRFSLVVVKNRMMVRYIKPISALCYCICASFSNRMHYVTTFSLC